MTNEIVKTATLTEEQIALVKRTVAKGATDDELALFLYQATKAGLDPLAKQIHYIKRKVKQADGSYKEHGSIQVGIDGYRLIADRTGKYAGNDAPVFVWGADKSHPLTATVTVWKLVGNLRCSFSATADWGFFCPPEKQAFMWRKGKGCFMLGKCAEALALRKAFPAELSGIYTDDEMAQAPNDEPSKGNSAPPQDATANSDTLPDGPHPETQDAELGAKLAGERDALIEQIGKLKNETGLKGWAKLKGSKARSLGEPYYSDIMKAYKDKEAELKGDTNG